MGATSRRNVSAWPGDTAATSSPAPKTLLLTPTSPDLERDRTGEDHFVVSILGSQPAVQVQVILRRVGCFRSRNRKRPGHVALRRLHIDDAEILRADHADTHSVRRRRLAADGP